MEYSSVPQQRTKRDQSTMNPGNPLPNFIPGGEAPPKRTKIDHQSALLALDSHAATKLTHLISKLKVEFFPRLLALIQLQFRILTLSGLMLYMKFKVFIQILSKNHILTCLICYTIRKIPFSLIYP